MEIRLGTTLAASAMAIALLATPAFAADVALEAPVAEKPLHDWDIAFGVTFTSDYISRGYTQTDHGPAIQPWAELTVGMIYLGYWGSNVDFPPDGWEHDFSIGIRPTLGPVNFDLGYVRYVYDSTGDCCGEIYGKASFSPVEPVTLGAAVYYDPDAVKTYVEGNASVALHYNVSASGAVGWQFYDVDPTDFSWNAGLSWAPYEWLKLDGRYHGGPEAEKFVVSLSLSSSLNALKGQ